MLAVKKLNYNNIAGMIFALYQTTKAPNLF